MRRKLGLLVLAVVVVASASLLREGRCGEPSRTGGLRRARGVAGFGSVLGDGEASLVKKDADRKASRKIHLRIRAREARCVFEKFGIGTKVQGEIAMLSNGVGAMRIDLLVVNSRNEKLFEKKDLTEQLVYSFVVKAADDIEAASRAGRGRRAPELDSLSSQSVSANEVPDDFGALGLRLSAPQPPDSDMVQICLVHHFLAFDYDLNSRRDVVLWFQAGPNVEAAGTERQMHFLQATVAKLSAAMLQLQTDISTQNELASESHLRESRRALLHLLLCAVPIAIQVLVFILLTACRKPGHPPAATFASTSAPAKRPA
ncbi:hypothetical protein FVE85_1344 [Porphyridium purpureum]|uniref:GOLD domain-containing protein n=1 Tax=Porphyridium purpureum TaxID=35688 RepID=A0A5J4YK72_PORPP|nr:hypothetical protein FVE85_1344 [Porphyridium purpureum]|eukprot:POR9698..scf251_18